MTGEPTYFATPAAFRRWLEANHAAATELLVGFYKTSSGKPSMTWPESVDEALCFGWIDGKRKSLSAEQDATRERRLATLIADSAAGRRIAPMNVAKQPAKPKRQPRAGRR